MSYFFCFVGVCCYAVAFAGWSIATTSIHEIQAGIVAIVGTLFIVTAGIIDALTAVRRAVVKSAQQPAAPESGPERAILCSACRKPVNRDSSECPHCGTKLSPPA
jgi:uncharacterized paraquat-inducible protein A